VVLPPPGYAAACFRAVRAAGGVCVADEVQVGLGRFGGDCFWGFQHGGGAAVGDGGGAVPDIVTVGKPFGNGVPLAAVVCTAAIAAAMEATTVEYFNTFGGNPVACAAGLAVLDVLEKEDLMASAQAVTRGQKQRLGKEAESTLRVKAMLIRAIAISFSCCCFKRYCF